MTTSNPSKLPLAPADWRFSPEGRVVIDRPDRPVRQIVQMMASGSHYFGICDTLLRGFSGRDYTRMLGEFDGPLFPKQQGRAVWIREGKNLHCATWAPEMTSKPRHLESSLGLGDVSLLWRDANLEARTTVFVPVGETAECWSVTVKNLGKSARRLDIALALPFFTGSRAYVEYHRDVVRLYNKPRTPDTSTILLENGLEWIEGKSGVSTTTYAAACRGLVGRKRLKPTHAWTDREDFLGPEGRWDRPRALLDRAAPRLTGLGRELVAAFEYRGVTLAPGETASFAFSAGVGLSKPEALAIARLADPARAPGLLAGVERFWQARVDAVKIETASRDFNIAWNRWWLHQSLIRHWFGNTGHPQFDYGTDFSGWREIWQDLLATAPLDPKAARAYAAYTLTGIRPDGTNATRFFARTKKFGSDEVNGLWCDHPYWTLPTIRLIADETGDLSFFLQGGIAYFRDAFRSRGDVKAADWPHGTIGNVKDTKGRVLKGTVIEHLLVQSLGMYFDCGKKGLLKHRRTDWNDAIDQVHGGENSVFTFGLCRNLRILAGTLRELNARLGVKTIALFEAAARLALAPDDKADSRRRQATMKAFLAAVDGAVDARTRNVPVLPLAANLEKKADDLARLAKRLSYNGEYFHGYFHADGRPIERTGESKIHLMPQTWSLLGEALDEKGESRLVSSVLRRLIDKNGGLRLNAPPYTAFDPSIGRITGFAPGTKENNAVFNHANLYFIHALLLRRRAEEAWRIFKGISAIHRDRALTAGPHMPEYWISSDHPHLSGRAEYPLLTGTGPWTRMVFPRFFFGVRGVVDGLLIDPVLPDDPLFRRSTLSLSFRGAHYRILFRSPRGVSAGRVVKAVVDGKPVVPENGSLLVRGPHKGERLVEVTLG